MQIEMLYCNKSTVEIEVEKLEQRISHKFPKEYRNFLIKYNGGSPKNGIYFVDLSVGNDVVSNFYGILDEAYEDIYCIWKNNRYTIPDRFVCIAGTPGGNQICISTSGEDVGFIYHYEHDADRDDYDNNDMTNVFLLAKTFDGFIDLLEKDFAKDE